MPTKLNQTKSLAYATGEMKAVDARPKPERLVVAVHTDTVQATFTIVLRPKLILGRGDNQNPVDVDLSSFGAIEKGVSRKHVMLLQHGTRLYILDLGSKNGTYINGKVLRAGSICELKDNNEISLGKLKLSVTFGYQPVATTLPDKSADEQITEPVRQDVLEPSDTLSDESLTEQTIEPASSGILKHLDNLSSE